MQFTASTNSPLVNIGAVAYNPQPVQSDCSANDTGVDIEMRVINNSSEPVLLNWIAFDCSEILYQVAQAGDTITQNSYIGHDWVVRFADGVAADQLAVSAEIFTIVIDPRPGTTTSIEAEPEIVYPITESGCEVAPVTADMGLDAFYGKYCDYDGLLIVSSGMVSNSALKQAWLVIANMFVNRSDVIESLVEMNFKVVIMGEDEVTTDVPELSAETDGDAVREFSKFREEPRVILTGEENLLCFRDDINQGEITLADTMGNATRFVFLFDLEPTFDDDKLESVYQSALSEGLWYSPINDIRGNYWKHGVQAYFNSADAALLTGETDDEINTRDELAEYDPQLYALVDSVYGTKNWIPECP